MCHYCRVAASFNQQLKPFATLTPTKHLPPNCESQFAARRLRGLTGCSGCRKTPAFLRWCAQPNRHYFLEAKRKINLLQFLSQRKEKRDFCRVSKIEFFYSRVRRLWFVSLS